jgi:RNA polymerase sigma-70 factor, ECF subfamily
MTRDLVDRAQRGDREAFEELARLVATRLFATATLILRDADLASDVVQETLIEVWRKLPTLRDTQAFDAWLNRILVRRCYRAARSATRLVADVRLIEMENPVHSEEWLVDTRDEIERAFRRLTPEQRAVLVVHHRLGLSDDEAATALGVPLGTMKSRLNRATAALRAGVEADSRESLALKGNLA